jgi:hypothetical protein
VSFSDHARSPDLSHHSGAAVKKSRGFTTTADENRAWLLICSAMIGERHGFFAATGGQAFTFLSAVPGGELQKR